MTRLTPTERLYEIAEAEGVAVVFGRLPRPLLGFYFNEPDVVPVVLLAPELKHNQPLLRCVFAEELGHHFTSAGDMLFRPYRSYMGRVLLSKAEKRALRWAADLLMPLMEVAAIAHELEAACELAERFGVTPTFVRAALQIPTYARLLEMLRASSEVS